MLVVLSLVSQLALATERHNEDGVDIGNVAVQGDATLQCFADHQLTLAALHWPSNERTAPQDLQRLHDLANSRRRVLNLYFSQVATSIALSTHVEAFVREQVNAGRYDNVSEVVRDALRLLERRQQEDEVKLQALRRAVAAGVASIDDDEFTLVEPQDIETLVSGLGATATARSSQRRAGRKGTGA